jgi:hypothetical protein
MSAAGETNSSPVPGTVFSSRQVRILKVAVIAMGILLVGGFAFVLAAIVYQASRPAQVAAGRSATDSLTQSGVSIDLPVPRDASVSGLSLDGNRLAVQLNGSAGAEIAIIDLASGKIVARVRLKPQ